MGLSWVDGCLDDGEMVVQQETIADIYSRKKRQRHLSCVAVSDYRYQKPYDITTSKTRNEAFDRNESESTVLSRRAATIV
jgi:hypothetical protein